MLCTSNVIYTLITHAQEPIKLLHSYGLLYKKTYQLKFEVLYITYF